MIHFTSENIEIPHLDQSLLQRWIKKTVAFYGKKVGTINYVFCDDKKIIEVNRQFLNHDYYTDIITFDYCKGKTVSSDLFISIDTVRSNAEKLNTDFNEELHRVIIHGVLHLCGEDDKTDKAQAEMTNAENKALKMLKEL